MIFENISSLCKKRGISIAGLEKAIGLGNGTIRGWVNSSPTVDRLVAVANYFGVTVNDLLSPDAPTS